MSQGQIRVGCASAGSGQERALNERLGRPLATLISLVPKP